MSARNEWRARKYSRRLKMSDVGPITTTYDGTWKSEYLEYLNSDAWKAKRELRLKYDGYKCTECPATENLQVHHKTYVRLRNESIHDLVTLCDGCHREQHLPLLAVVPKYSRENK